MMSAISLRLEKYGVPPPIARRVRKRIGYGTEGAVYDIGGGKILKVNVMAPARHSIDVIYRKIKGRRWAAPMSAHGSLQGRGFWYVSPKLYPIERRYIDALDDLGMMYLRMTRGSVRKETYERYVREQLKTFPEGLAAAVRAARRAGYRDLHGTNVMRTKSGIYKVIDVESIVRGRR